MTVDIMKVLLVNSFFPPWRGGAETYVYNLSKHLTEHGHKIRVICGNTPVGVGQQVVNGIEVERLRVTGGIFGTPLIPELPLTLARQTADIIHANFPSPYNAYFSSVTSRVRGIPAILTWHNDLPPVTRTARVIVAVHDYLLLPLYLPRFKYIIATSEIYAKTSRILNARKERVVIIPNGVDTKRFNPNVNADDLRSQLGLWDCKIILLVGALTRWHGYKGLDVLIKAIALLKDQPPESRLLVVGDGELKSDYAHLATDLRVRDRVIFAGNVPDAELPRYYAVSDLLILPSKDRSEGFGLTILEANATGKPAIGTTVGGIPNVIRDGYNGLLVRPNDSQALAEAIKTLLSNEELLRQMGKNGRALAEQHDWSTVAGETENLYRRALET